MYLQQGKLRDFPSSREWRYANKFSVLQSLCIVLGGYVGLLHLSIPAGSRTRLFSSTEDGRIGFYTMKNQPYLELIDYETFVPVRDLFAEQTQCILGR